MKVIYNCYGSAHSSVLAAAIHVGMLPIDRVPKTEEITKLPHYDKTATTEIGNIYYFGTDEAGIEVYILGMKGSTKLVKRAIYSMLSELEISKNELLFVETLPYVNNLTRIGGFLSRKLGLVSLGRPLTIWGLQKVYHQFVELVKDVKGRLFKLAT